MQTIKLKKMVFTGLVMVLCAIGFTAQAQEKTYADKWAKNETGRYVQDLGLTEEQAGKVHEILLTTAKKAEEIKETKTGDAQKKAIWQNSRERLKMVNEVLTPEQQQKLKELKKKK